MAKNTPTENLLEQEGRIKSEPQTKNVRAEEIRVVAEIKDEKDWKKNWIQTSRRYFFSKRCFKLFNTSLRRTW